MTWTRGASGTDPVNVNLSVTDLTTSTMVGQLSSIDNSSFPAADTWQSNYLGGNGYLWFTFWSDGFSGNTLDVADAAASMRSVPEPGSGALFIGGAALLLAFALIRRKPIH